MKRRSLNKTCLIGNVVQAPELQHTKSNMSVCTFFVITNSAWESKSGYHEDSTRHICVAWDKLAEICCDFLRKGTLVYVEGALQNVIVNNLEDDQEEMRLNINEMLVLAQPNDRP